MRQNLQTRLDALLEHIALVETKVAEPLITIPYLEKLIAVSEWTATEVLGKLIRNLKNEWSGVDPFPVSELWSYLEDRGVAAEEILRFKSIPIPREKSKTKAPSLADSYLAVSRTVGKSVALSGINLETDHHLIPDMLAWGKAIAGLKGAARNLWTKAIQKVILQGEGRGSEDASYSTGGRIHLVLKSKARPVEVLRAYVIHELGHALQDHTKLTLPIGGLYGSPPFVSSYAADNNPDEDFSETFQAFMQNPQHLRRTAPKKHQDMAARVSKL